MWYELAWRRAALAALWAVAGLGGPAVAGLAGQVTSPGPLSYAHADWDAPRECSRCHELDGRTVDARCLACHEPLAGRIAAGEGYHAARASDCASCHREHEGSEARIVRFDPAGFDHATIGYPLGGDHADLDCSGCHNTLGVRDRDVRLFKGRYGALTRTYLGLEPSCGSCHATRSPHAGQFAGRECADCHGEREWTSAPRFEHARTRYALTGRHGVVACEGCHREREATVVYRPLSFGECSSCHRDAHAGEMGAGCGGCHSTAGWARIARGSFEGDFDHAATAFPLRGRHAATACAACHRPRPAGDPEIALAFRAGGLPSYPTPAFEACGSCHLDAHDGMLADAPTGPECAACHTERGWAPSEFDVFMHERGPFPLTGAHRVVPCAGCHAALPPMAAEPPTPERSDDPRGQADAAAAAAHGPEAPERPPFRIRLGVTECAACHAPDDPHGDQFAGRACESCHDTRSYRVESFDHAATRFPLEAAHAEAACASCHRPEEDADGALRVRYRPLDASCRSCHGPSGGRRAP